MEDSGGTRACWTQTKRSMWKAFFGNCASKNARNFGAHRKQQLLQRSVVPCFDYRNSRWPPHRQRCLEVDQLQRKMMAIIHRTPMLPGEAPAEYVRRRHILSAKRCKESGLWSVRHCTRVIAWRDHITRPANRHSWAALLLEFRGLQWLAERRSAFSSGLLGILAGRTGTRVAAGNVATRWHDGVRFAEALLGQ